LIPRWLSPLAGMTKCKFDSLELLNNSKLAIPTLFIGTADDKVVPPEQMKQLFRAAKIHATPECKDNVRMFRYEGESHHQVAATNQDAFFKNLLEWTCKVFLKDQCTEDEIKKLVEGMQVGEGVVEEEEEEIVMPGESETTEDTEDVDSDMKLRKRGKAEDEEDGKKEESD